MCPGPIRRWLPGPQPPGPPDHHNEIVDYAHHAKWWWWFWPGLGGGVSLGRSWRLGPPWAGAPLPIWLAITRGLHKHLLLWNQCQFPGMISATKQRFVYTGECMSAKGSTYTLPIQFLHKAKNLFPTEYIADNLFSTWSDERQWWRQVWWKTLSRGSWLSGLWRGGGVGSRGEGLGWEGLGSCLLPGGFRCSVSDKGSGFTQWQYLI